MIKSEISDFISKIAKQKGYIIKKKSKVSRLFSKNIGSATYFFEVVKAFDYWYDIRFGINYKFINPNIKILYYNISFNKASLKQPILTRFEDKDGQEFTEFLMRMFSEFENEFGSYNQIIENYKIQKYQRHMYGTSEESIYYLIIILMLLDGKLNDAKNEFNKFNLLADSQPKIVLEKKLVKLFQIHAENGKLKEEDVSNAQFI